MAESKEPDSGLEAAPRSPVKSPSSKPTRATRTGRSGDTRYLEQRRQGWYAVVEVPPALRDRLGRKRLRKTLGTGRLETAQAARWGVVAALKAEIAAARKQETGDPLVKEALAYRAAIEAGRLASDPDDHDWLGITMDAARERSEQIHAKDYAAGELFDGLATGSATPLSMHLETWLTEGGQHGQFQERTKGDHRRAVNELREWLQKEHLPPTLEAIDRRAAGLFVSKHLLPSGRAQKTITKTLSSLSTYWAWLRKRGHLPDDQRTPWAEQAASKRAAKAPEEALERPFTDAEVATLLAGPATPILADFMRVAALSGMRREEIGRLTVADCAWGMFIIQRGKTAAARRRVPVHPKLAEIVARRTKDKAPGDYLFHDLTSKRAERTDAIGKQFQRYREALGVDDGAGRRSLVNFHSFRRWMVTAAVNSGQPPHMVSLVVGHTEGRKGMTLGRYWHGADDDALRAVVEAVKLPADRI